MNVIRELTLGLDPALDAAESSTVATTLPKELLNGEWSLEQVKHWYAQHVSARAPSQTQAAERLGIDRGTLKKLLKSPQT